ncbi:hypothetical protein [Halobacteriovorax sp. HLS]|uniref:hypothetical protein n=1 Tax=Halobacteriovorax sp. HLS TaxID=2234000 RepID=UPI000FD80AC0|nr:hypothetical protein [Halobacteriovorax sp. HLS]
MDKDNLKNAIQDIMNKNQVNAPKRNMIDKKILQYEADLLSANVNVDYSICLADIFQDERSKKFGGGDFTRQDYALNWKKWKEQGHRFILTNIKHSNSKLLLECPEQFKKDTLETLPQFIELLAKSVTKTINE